MPVQLTPGGEVAVFLDNIDQFEGGESEFECVAFAASMVWHAVQLGKPNPYSNEDVDAWADHWYAFEEGSYDASNTNGMGVPELQDLLTRTNLTWIQLPIDANSQHESDMAQVRAALEQGYPVLLCGAEEHFVTAVGDQVPYTWHPFGNHCIVATGIAPSGNFWVRDTAAMANGWAPSVKREYDNARMFLISGHAIVPAWLKGGTTLENSGMFTAFSHDFSLYFHQVDENHWQCKQTGKILQFGLLAFYRGLTLDGQTLPLLGLPLSDEHPAALPGGKTITVQDFERGRLASDPKHLQDSQPGCRDVYLLKTGALPGA
jgi:hypothetical protein